MRTFLLILIYKYKHLKKPKPTIQDLIDKGNPSIKIIYANLRPQIRAINEDIYEYSTNAYIGYKLISRKKLFAEVHIQQNKIVFHLRPIDYFASELSIQKVPDSHKWTLNKLVSITSETEIEKVINLIVQSYNDI